MAEKDTSKKDQNNTGTELDILKRLERQFWNKNPNAIRRNTEKSQKWFSDYVTKNWQHVRTSQMMRDRSMWKQRLQIGKMYFYEYDALHKATLPVWDRYPLGFVVNVWSDKGKSYFSMIQLHYLPPALRLIVFRTLLTIRADKRYRKSTKLAISWEALMSLSNTKLFKHSIKTYRMDQVRSVFVEIPAQSWELSAFLPLQRFQKGGKSAAWNIKKG